MKLDQSVQVVNKKVTIGDIAQIQCSDYAVTKQINKIIALQVKGDKNQKKVISSLKLIELIRREIREAQIVLVGETDVVVEYHIPKQENKALEYLKLLVLTCIVFFGSAFTIMTFDELTHAAEQGNAGAQAQLGRLLIQKHYFQVGIHFMLESVSQTGSMEDIFFVNIAINNVTSEDEKQKILEELHERAEADECTASYILGQCYEDSNIVTQNHEKSIYYYERGARCGFFPATEKLGAYYLEVKDDVKEGMLWYFRAVEAGSDNAWRPIGLNIFITRITMGTITRELRTDADVVQILTYCAEKGAIFAQFLLARRYEKGRGVPQNIAQAQYWYDRIKHYVTDLQDITNVIEGMMYTTWGYIPEY